MPASRYDIQIEQGETLNLFLTYKDTDLNPVDLTGFEARMQVRRYQSADKLILRFSGNRSTGTVKGMTGNGIDISSTGGGDATGGVFLNSSSTGVTGIGVTGGIFVSCDAVQTSYLPAGKHWYDLEVQDPYGEVNKIIKGRFEVFGEVTR